LRRRRGWATGAAAAVLVAATLTAAGVAASPAVRAQVQRLACFVPGLGIRNCAGPGLVAPDPVTVLGETGRLTVESVLAAEGDTTVRIRLYGIGFGVGPDPNNRPSVRVALRDTSGRAYPPLGRDRIEGSPAVLRGDRGWDPNAAPAYFGDVRFAPLHPDVREVEVTVHGLPSGEMRALVAVAPAAAAAAETAHEPGAAATRHGITVEAARVAADAQRTVVQLAARSDDPARPVRTIANRAPPRRLVLRDDQGRAHGEETGLRPPAQATPGTYTEDVVFPAVPPPARTAELVVPFVTVAEQTGAARWTVHLGARRENGTVVPARAPAAGTPDLFEPTTGREAVTRVPVGADLQVGAYPFRLAAAVVDDRPDGRWLALHLDLGGWRNGRKLVSVGVRVEGVQPSRFELRSGGDETGQIEEVRMPLPPEVGEDVPLVFERAEVAVEGPWRLTVPLGR
jgi:hypothetical protein